MNVAHKQECNLKNIKMGVVKWLCIQVCSVQVLRFHCDAFTSLSPSKFTWFIIFVDNVEINWIANIKANCEMGMGIGMGKWMESNAFCLHSPLTQLLGQVFAKTMFLTVKSTTFACSNAILVNSKWIRKFTCCSFIIYIDGFGIFNNEAKYL